MKYLYWIRDFLEDNKLEGAQAVKHSPHLVVGAAIAEALIAIEETLVDIQHDLYLIQGELEEGNRARTEASG